MNQDKTYIYETTKAIIEDVKTLSREELDIKYEKFKTDFYKLYETAIIKSATPYDTSMFLRELAIMLAIRQDVISGKKTDIEANIQVGEYMAKKYVYPKTGEPTIEQKKVALKKIVKKHEEEKKEREKDLAKAQEEQEKEQQ